MRKFIKNTKIDFVSKFRIANYVSIIFITLGLLLLLFKGPELGIDFKGGTELIIKLDNNFISKESVEEFLNINNIECSSIKSYGLNKLRVLFDSDVNQEFVNQNLNVTLKN